jgi:hypothetical protein
MLAQIFDDFAALSNLRLNYEKCVIIPLNPVGLTPPEQSTTMQSDSDVAVGPLQKLKKTWMNGCLLGIK